MQELKIEEAEEVQGVFLAETADFVFKPQILESETFEGAESSTEVTFSLAALRKAVEEEVKETERLRSEEKAEAIEEAKEASPAAEGKKKKKKIPKALVIPDEISSKFGDKSTLISETSITTQVTYAGESAEVETVSPRKPLSATITMKVDSATRKKSAEFTFKPEEQESVEKTVKKPKGLPTAPKAKEETEVVAMFGRDEGVENTESTLLVELVEELAMIVQAAAKKKRKETRVELVDEKDEKEILKKEMKQAELAEVLASFCGIEQREMFEIVAFQILNDSTAISVHEHLDKKKKKVPEEKKKETEKIHKKHEILPEKESEIKKVVARELEVNIKKVEEKRKAEVIIIERMHEERPAHLYEKPKEKIRMAFLDEFAEDGEYIFKITLQGAKPGDTESAVQEITEGGEYAFKITPRKAKPGEAEVFAEEVLVSAEYAVKVPKRAPGKLETLIEEISEEGVFEISSKPVKTESVEEVVTLREEDRVQAPKETVIEELLQEEEAIIAEEDIRKVDHEKVSEVLREEEIKQKKVAVKKLEVNIKKVEEQQTAEVAIIEKPHELQPAFLRELRAPKEKKKGKVEKVPEERKISVEEIEEEKTVTRELEVNIQKVEEERKAEVVIIERLHEERPMDVHEKPKQKKRMAFMDEFAESGEYVFKVTLRRAKPADIESAVQELTEGGEYAFKITPKKAKPGEAEVFAEEISIDAEYTVKVPKRTTGVVEEVTEVEKTVSEILRPAEEAHKITEPVTVELLKEEKIMFAEAEITEVLQDVASANLKEKPKKKAVRKEKTEGEEMKDHEIQAAEKGLTVNINKPSSSSEAQVIIYVAASSAESLKEKEVPKRKLKKVETIEKQEVKELITEEETAEVTVELTKKTIEQVTEETVIEMSFETNATSLTEKTKKLEKKKKVIEKKEIAEEAISEAVTLEEKKPLNETELAVTITQKPQNSQAEVSILETVHAYDSLSGQETGKRVLKKKPPEKTARPSPAETEKIVEEITKDGEYAFRVVPGGPQEDTETEASAALEELASGGEYTVTVPKGKKSVEEIIVEEAAFVLRPAEVVSLEEAVDEVETMVTLTLPHFEQIERPSEEVSEVEEYATIRLKQKAELKEVEDEKQRIKKRREGFAVAPDKQVIVFRGDSAKVRVFLF